MTPTHLIGIVDLQQNNKIAMMASSDTESIGALKPEEPRVCEEEVRACHAWRGFDLSNSATRGGDKI